MWDCGTKCCLDKTRNIKGWSCFTLFKVCQLRQELFVMCQYTYIDQAMQGFLRFSLGPAPLSCQSLKITSIVIHATQVHAIPCDFLKISLCGTKHSKSIESILFFGQCHLRAKLKLLKLSAKQLKLNSGHSCIFKAEFRGIFIFQAEYRKIGQLKHNIEGGMYIKS